MTEDLQKRYENRTDPKLSREIPLAADAAHLLTEYLDTVNIELSRQGVIEPFSITKQIEEMILAEIESKADRAKMTYDTVSRILESFGSPQQVAKRYIKENDPTIKKMLTAQERPAEEEQVRLQYRRPTDTLPSIDVILALAFPLFIGLFLGRILVEQLLLVSSTPFPHTEYNTYLTIAAVLYSIMEIRSGLTGVTGITVRAYTQIRSFLKNTFMFTAILMGINFLTINGYLLGNPITIISIMFPPLLVIVVTTIRDHTPGMFPLKKEFKPWIRFLSPSYLLLLAATGLVFLSIAFISVNYDYFYIMNIVAIFMTIISTAAYIRRKAPISARKLLAPVLFFYWFYRAAIALNNTVSEVMGYTVSEVMGWLIFSLLIYLLMLPLIFRKEVKELGRSYKNQLQSMEQ